jgi:hypothetical protein
MRKSVLLFGGCLAGLLLGSAFVAYPRAQVEVDRIVTRVNGRIITQSDIRQARTLKLVDDAASDEGARRSLENRLLILNELNRASPLAPASEEDIDARRAEWRNALGANADAALGKTAMSESDLQGWMRDDLRIRAYMKRQFGMLPEAERARATAEWLTRLRQRADLPQ